MNVWIAIAVSAGMPMGQQGVHDHGVVARGEKVMGFAHDKTAHRFRILSTGGKISVEAKDSRDEVSIQQIRDHLAHIAMKFAAGDFDAPMLIHGVAMPGVPEMQKLKAEIRYRFHQTRRGGAVMIETKNSDAKRAVHRFLRFQIEDHHTGDLL